VVKTIRPDTVFIPYHWAGLKSANQLTHRTLDPRSKIPEFKVSACRIEKTVAPTGWSKTAKTPGRSQHAPKRELRVIQ
jgi:assimilatory nitrate reductase catalytic subunit